MISYYWSNFRIFVCTDPCIWRTCLM